MKKLALTIIIATFFAVVPAFIKADDGVNYKKLERSGFQDIVQILEGMTPEQRAQIMEQAEAMADEMEGMSARDRMRLEGQVRMQKSKLSKQIKEAKEDPTSVNTNRSINLEKAKKDIGLKEKVKTASKKRVHRHKIIIKKKVSEE